MVICWIRLHRTRSFSKKVALMSISVYYSNLGFRIDVLPDILFQIGEDDLTFVIWV